jgi:glucokinase
MEIKWLSGETSFDKLVLAGDIGGTNTNLAIVGEKAGKFTIILEVVYKSSEVQNIVTPLKEVLAIAKEKSPTLRPEICCISAAGAVSNNACKLTNCNWDVDGAEISRQIGIETTVINDFLAISYGIPTLDIEDPTQIQKIAHTDGSYAAPQAATKAVVGPGTGLGVAYLAYNKGKYVPGASEGGHSCFAPFNAESKAFQQYLSDKFGMAPGVEPLVSGQGIKNLFHFYKDVKKIALTGVLAEINAASDEDKPALISKNADSNEVCKEIMTLFAQMLAAFASNIALIFMPFGGLYLAGGVVIKNQSLLLNNNLFMNTFEKNYNANIGPLLKKVPVYIIKDYSISLYGAANAGIQLQA